MNFRRWSTLAFRVGVVFVAATVMAGQPLETDTARLRAQGKAMIESTFEFRTSSKGRETAWPWLFEYGITDRLEFAVEPVAHTVISPKLGHWASGTGDLEATATFLINKETARRPAIAIAAEVKLPFSKDRLIGTGKTDFAGCLIVNRQFKKFDVHGNLGYTVLSEPKGVSLNNLFSFALAGEYHANPRRDFVGEIIANTSAAPGLEVSGNTTKTLTEQTAEPSLQSYENKKIYHKF